MLREANLIWRYEDSDNGLICPWYTLPALQWLKQQDVSGWSIFEYGLGYSSIWWAENARVTFGVDNNKTWAKCGPANRTFLEEDIYLYTTSINLNKDYKWEPCYDCVIVDGEFRLECIIEGKMFINKGGYLIFDNYGQAEFPSTEVIDNLLEGWEKQIFKQLNHTDWCTAVFRKP